MSSTFEIEIAPSGENGIQLDYITLGMKKGCSSMAKNIRLWATTRLQATRDRRTG